MLVAEVLGIVTLVALVAVFGPRNQAAAQAFADRLGAWVGPITGVVCCAMGGHWVANRSAAPVVNGVAMGVAAALLDLGLAAALGSAPGPLLLASNAGRILAATAGGILAARREAP